MARINRVERLARKLPAGPERYQRQLRDILPYIDDAFALAKPTKYHRAQVAKYHRLIFGDADTPRLFSFDKRVFRSKNKKHLAMAQAYGRHPPGYPHLNVAFIPESGKGSRVSFTKDSMRITSGNIIREVREFESKLIFRAVKEARTFISRNGISPETFTQRQAEAMDDAYVASLIEQVERVTLNDPAGLYYQIICGDAHTYPSARDGGGFDRQSLIDTLKWMLVKYENNVIKWLNGIVAYSIKPPKRGKLTLESTLENFQAYMSQVDEKRLRNRANRFKQRQRKKRKRS